MSIQMDLKSVTISRDDLAVVADATDIRFPTRAAESRRIARLRTMLATASDLSRALSDHTRHSLIDCQGTHGTWDLARDVDDLYRALVAYSTSIQELAEEYRPVVRGPARIPDDVTIPAQGEKLDIGAA